MVSNGPDQIQIQWTPPKCGSTLPVANYSVSVIPHGSESGKQITHWIATQSSLNISRDLFQLIPCTDYVITVRPLFSNIQWMGDSTPLAASTTPALDDRIGDFRATWEEDQLSISWTGLNCTRSLTGWQLTASDDDLNHTRNVIIPKQCTQVDETGRQNHIRLLLETEGIVCHDSTLHEFYFNLKACVTYSFSLLPVWADDFYHHDLPVSVTVRPLIRSKRKDP